MGMRNDLEQGKVQNYSNRVHTFDILKKNYIKLKNKIRD